MEQRVRKFQITCRCRKYKFPHRLGGGKCTGDTLCETIYEGYHSTCRHCPNNIDHRCQVADGIESIDECRVVQELIEREQSYPIGFVEPMMGN